MEQEVSFKRSGYADFALILGGLALVRLVLPFIPVPLAIKPYADTLLTVIFLSLPLVAIYRAMSEKPDAKRAAVLFLSGAAIHGALVLLDLYVFNGKGAVSGLLSALKPIGLQIWCVGLGALVASLISDRNLLIPIGIFLIGYDIFLVLTPLGFTQKLMKAAPAILQQGGMSIPAVSTKVAANGKAEISGVIGPADLVFLGTFFLAMFRFDMRPYATLRIMIPVLLMYLLFVMVSGISLPALVPIGLVSLVVNWKLFRLNKEEKLATGLIALIVIGILTYSATRPKPPPEPSNSARARAIQKLAKMQSQGALNSPQS